MPELTSDALKSIDVASSGNRGAARLERGVTLAVLLLGISASFWVLWIAQESGEWPWLTAVPFVIFPLAASVKLFRTASRCSGDERKAWLCFSFACLLYTGGEANWMYYDLVLGDPTPSPSLGDIGYLGFSTTFIVGIWYYHQRAKSVDFTLAQIGNLGVIFSAVLLAYLFPYYNLVKTNDDFEGAVFAVLYGVFNGAVLLFALAVLSLHVWGHKRTVLLLIVAGLSILAGMDFLYGYSLLHQGYQSSDVVNGCYPIVFSLIYLAAFEQDRLGPEDTEITRYDRSPLGETLVAPLAVALVIVITFVFRGVITEETLRYALGPLALFVVSLAVRNWWGQKAESQLRYEALASKAELQSANEELWDEMQTRSRIEDELRQSQKMEAVGQLTGGVAHDFNNLLAVIISNLEIAEAKLVGDPPIQECLHDASAAALHAASLTQSLLSLSRKQALNPQSLETARLLSQMSNLLERTLGEQVQVTIEECDDLWPCFADRAQMESAILNLAINSRDAMPNGGELTIHGSNIDLDETYAAEHPGSVPGSYVQICLRDTGEGIPEEVLSRVFEPFFTTKELGAGTGLGLSMVYGFAKQSGGHLEIESDPGRGTEVRLYLPVTAQNRTTQPREETDLPRGNRERVFVVEDESAVRKLVVKLLCELGYEVVAAAADGPEALALIGEVDSVDLFFSDVVLPGGYSGPELASEISMQQPAMRVLLMSGYAPESIMAECSNTMLLNKPFRTAEFARAVRDALDA